MKETNEFIRFVIEREDGQYYQRSSISSSWCYTDDFSNAYLFKTEHGAKQRAFTANPMKTTVKKVKITLLDE